MKILITNDDGIQAEGIKRLIKIMKAFGELYIVAPTHNMSAIGHAMTLNRPLKVDDLEIKNVKRAASLDGTPADCIKYAISFLKIEPDIVISGINDEANLGTDILYSGTVSGAIEANLFNYPAIALSTTASNFQTVEVYLPKILRELVKNPLESDTTLNINFPKDEQPKGIKITTVGISSYENRYIEEEGGYRLTGPFIDIDQPEETDVKTVRGGYISITPLKFKLDDDLKRKALERMIKNIDF